MRIYGVTAVRVRSVPRQLMSIHIQSIILIPINSMSISSSNLITVINNNYINITKAVSTINSQ